MKAFLLAILVATAAGAAMKPGDACEKASDDCGDATTMCCGVATGGKMCSDNTCGTTSDTNPVPNFVVCNNKPAADGTGPKSWVATQPNADASASIYMQFPGDKAFTCLVAPTEEEPVMMQ